MDPIQQFSSIQSEFGWKKENKSILKTSSHPSEGNVLCLIEL